MARRHVRNRCASSRGGGVTLSGLRWVLVVAVVAPAAYAKYPQDALQCMASRKEPEGQLICPEHRNGYCVKEESTLAKEDCGRTTYFGDKWNSKTGKCEYRKCDSKCVQTSWDFEFEGEAYMRNRECCNSNLCNGTARQAQRPSPLAWITGVVALLLAQAYYTSGNNRPDES